MHSTGCVLWRTLTADPAEIVGQVFLLSTIFAHDFSGSGSAGQQTTPFGFEDEMLEALAAGTIDGAAASPASIGYFNLRQPGQPLRLVHAYEQEPELSWNVAVGMRGSDAALRQRIDGVIERMLADGTIRDIYARYGIEHRPPSNSR